MKISFDFPALSGILFKSTPLSFFEKQTKIALIVSAIFVGLLSVGYVIKRFYLRAQPINVPVNEAQSQNKPVSQSKPVNEIVNKAKPFYPLKKIRLEPIRAFSQAKPATQVKPVSEPISKSVSLALQLKKMCSMANTFNNPKSPSNVIELINAGADLTYRDPSNGNTPLHWLVVDSEFSTPEIIKLCLDKGADVNAKNADGETPLNLLARFNKWDIRDHKKCIQALLKVGADVTIPNNENIYPLQKAFRRNGSEVLSELYIDKINGITNEYKQTPLILMARHFSAWFPIGNETQLFEKMVMASDLELMDNNGNCALHFAARSQFLDGVNLLLKHAPNTVHFQNKEGHTPLYDAVKPLLCIDSDGGGGSFDDVLKNLKAICNLWLALRKKNLPKNDFDKILHDPLYKCAYDPKNNVHAEKIMHLFMKESIQDDANGQLFIDYCFKLPQRENVWKIKALDEFEAEFVQKQKNLQG